MTPFDFIFMLTRNDRTVADAAVHAETALRAGIRQSASRTSACRSTRSPASPARSARAEPATTSKSYRSTATARSGRSRRRSISASTIFSVAPMPKTCCRCWKGRPSATIPFRAASSGTRAISKDRRPRSSKAPSRSPATPVSPVSTFSPTVRQAMCLLSSMLCAEPCPSPLSSRDRWTDRFRSRLFARVAQRDLPSVPLRWTASSRQRAPDWNSSCGRSRHASKDIERAC